MVGTVTNADVELPGTTGTDYRLTDRDAIIAKVSIPITPAGAGTFPHLATLPVPSPIPGAPDVALSIPRGWVAADLRAGGRTIRLVDTHLEAFSADVATQQVADLLAVSNPTRQPTIVLGDMNLPPGSPGYDRFLASETGLRDAWTVANGSDPGLTCCWDRDLRSGAYTNRIDLVFATEPLRATRATKANDGSVRTAERPRPLGPRRRRGDVRRDRRDHRGGSGRVHRARALTQPAAPPWAKPHRPPPLSSRSAPAAQPPGRRYIEA